MKNAFDRKAWDKELEGRQKDSYDRREDTGMYKSIFKEDVPRAKILRKFVEGEHQINIVAYQVGDYHPSLEPGKIAYYLELYVHGGIGPTKDNYICLSRTYKKPCPVCEYQAQLRDEDADEETVNSLYPKRRIVYNLEIVDSPKEQAKGVQLFEVAHFSFTKPLEEAAKLPKGGGLVNYASTSGGKTISFEIKGGTYKNKQTGKTGNKSDYTSFHFIDRDPLSDDLYAQAFTLDEIVHIPSYEEVYEALHQEKADLVEKEAEKEAEREEDDIPPFDEEQSTENIIPTACVFEGVVFGEQFDEFEDCASCEIKFHCEAKKEELEKAKKAKKPAPKSKETEKSEPRRRPGR